MHTHTIHTVLAKLISLTNERDVAALELSLAQALFDLIAPVESEGTKSVVIYRVVDISKQLFSMVVVGEKSKETNLSAHLKQSLSDCFKSGVSRVYKQDGESSATLYPLTNATGHVMAIIAIEASLCDPHLHETISMLLQICLLYTSPSPRDATLSRMPSSA